MSKITEILQEWKDGVSPSGFEDYSLSSEAGIHIDLLRALDILTDQIARVADALETHNEGSLLHDTSAADAWEDGYRTGLLDITRPTHDAKEKGEKPTEMREAK